MGLKKLAEALILQSVEDLWDEKHRSDSIAFFTGRDFHIVAEAAGMDTESKIQLMRMVRRISSHTKKPKIREEKSRQYPQMRRQGRILPSFPACAPLKCIGNNSPIFFDTFYFVSPRRVKS